MLVEEQSTPFRSQRQSTGQSLGKDRAQGSLWELSPDKTKGDGIGTTDDQECKERVEGSPTNYRRKSILSKARIIGCTTTKAAMCKTLLNEVGAGILLVEEAAEIRDADVLTR